MAAKKPTNKGSKSKSAGNKTTGNETGFITHFKHWRSGEIIYAKNYGLKAFPIGGRRK